MGLSFSDSTANTQTPHLLTLPLEVRLKIYHLSFLDPNPLSPHTYVKVDLHSSRILVRPHIWALFQTCQQIYAEIVPEYYSCTEFHFTALAHLRTATASHAAFRQHVRHVVLNPNYDLPHLSDIKALPALATFTVANVSCYEPIGTDKGQALSYATLRAVIGRDGGDFWATRLKQARVLYEAVCGDEELVARGVELVLRFRYTYVDKSRASLGAWGPAKRHKVVDYRYRGDVFVVLNADEGGRGVVSAAIEGGG